MAPFYFGFKNTRAWLRNAWSSIAPECTSADVIRELCEQNAKLCQTLMRTEAGRRTMRDSIVEHMAREQELRQEISSLKRHLNMAIDERDRARKRKLRTS